MIQKFSDYSIIVEAIALILTSNTKRSISKMLRCLDIPKDLKLLIRGLLNTKPKEEVIAILRLIAVQLKELSCQEYINEENYIYSLYSMSASVFLTFVNLLLTGTNSNSLFNQIYSVYLKENGILEIYEIIGNVKYRTFLNKLDKKANLRVRNVGNFNVENYNILLNEISSSSFPTTQSSIYGESSEYPGWSTVSNVFSNPCRVFGVYTPDGYLTVLEENSTIVHSYFPDSIGYFSIKNSLSLDGIETLTSLSFSENLKTQVITGKKGIFISNNQWLSSIERFKDGQPYLDYNSCCISIKNKVNEEDIENSYIWCGKMLHLIYGKNFLETSAVQEYVNGIGTYHPENITSISAERTSEKVYVGVGEFMYQFGKETYGQNYSIGQITCVYKVLGKNRILLGSILNEEIILSYVDSSNIRNNTILLRIARTNNDYIESITSTENGVYNVASFKSGRYYISQDNSSTWREQGIGEEFKSVKITANNKNSVLIGLNDRLYKKSFESAILTTSQVIPQFSLEESSEQFLEYGNLVFDLSNIDSQEELKTKIEEKQKNIVLIRDGNQYIELRI